MSHAEQWYSLVKDAFDVLYKEGTTQPKMMSVGMHMRIIGQPARVCRSVCRVIPSSSAALQTLRQEPCGSRTSAVLRHGPT